MACLIGPIMPPRCADLAAGEGEVWSILKKRNSARCSVGVLAFVFFGPSEGKTKTGVPICREQLRFLVLSLLLLCFFRCFGLGKKATCRNRPAVLLAVCD